MFRKIIYFILIFGFGVFLFFSRGDIKLMAIAISQGKTIWLLAALLIELIYFATYIYIFQKSFQLVGLNKTIKELIPLVFGAFFVNILAPATGHAGTILFADDSKQKNEPVGKAIIGVVLTFFAIYLALIVFLIIGIFNLKIIGELGFGEIFASIIFLAVTIAPIAAIWAGHFSPKSLRKVLDTIYKIQLALIRLFNPKKEATKSWVDESSEEILESAVMASKNPRDALYIVFISVISHFINVICLLLIFFALGIRIKYSIAITGYAFGEITRVISPQPEGVGTVEVMMVFIFSLFGIPGLVATTAVIIYRAMNVWLPMGVGFLSLRRLKSFKSEKALP